MSLALVSEILLRAEIERIENDKTSPRNDLWHYQCQKELAVIERLKINKIDMCGEVEELRERLERNAVYFMDAKKFENMEEKARKYDLICDLVND